MDDNPNGLATLYSKMATIMGNVVRLPKDGNNAFQKYNFTTESAIADTIRKELAGQNIAFLATLIDVQQTPKDKGFHTVATFEFTFACGDTGAAITRRWIGEADDSMDKGINKASTLAMKFFLLRTFVMSTGDPTDDPDSGVDAAPKSKAAASAPRPAQKPAPKSAAEFQKFRPPAPAQKSEPEPADVVNAAGGAPEAAEHHSEVPQSALDEAALTEEVRKTFPWAPEESKTRIEDMIKKYGNEFWQKFWPATTEKLGFPARTRQTQVHNALGIESLKELDNQPIGVVWFNLYVNRPQPVKRGQLTRPLEVNPGGPDDKEPDALAPTG